MKKKRVINYLTQWWVSNIGNIFIDIGAILSISECLSDKEYILVQSSSFPTKEAMSIVYKFNLIFKPLWKIIGKRMGRNILDKGGWIVKPSNAFGLYSVIRADYFIVAGCVLTIPFLKGWEYHLTKLKEKGTKLIFYGCGGSTYSDTEINFVRRQLKKLQPYALLTRDSIAFQEYSDLAEHSFDGIDCAFFVNKLPLKEIELDIPPYVVLTFDNPQNKKIEKDLEKKYSNMYKIIKCSHIPFSEGKGFHEGSPDESDFTSDLAYDYLNLYAHAEEVHADRVHACVPALAFGVPCRLYSKTPRANLFEKVCIGDITKELCYPKDLEKLQKKQISFLSQILE